jgi:hypothetical protein
LRDSRGMDEDPQVVLASLGSTRYQADDPRDVRYCDARGLICSNWTVTATKDTDCTRRTIIVVGTSG